MKQKLAKFWMLLLLCGGSTVITLMAIDVLIKLIGLIPFLVGATIVAITLWAFYELTFHDDIQEQRSKDLPYPFGLD